MNLYMKLLLLLTLVFPFMPAVGQEVKVYDQFNDFAHVLENRNDTLYVVNFWATWCKPCVDEMPYFIEANEQFEGKKFKMILVSLDFKSQLDSKVLPFIKSKNIQAEVVLLADTRQHAWIDKVDAQWTGSIPATVIFNKDFYYFTEGSMNRNDLFELITKNIKQ